MPTTGTARTATAAAHTARLPTAAAPTATAPTRTRRAWPRCCAISNRSMWNQLPTGALLPAQQLQPRLFRQRRQCLHGPERQQHGLHHPAVEAAPHRRRPGREGHLLRRTKPGRKH